mgnify:CR=1 FL=1
MDWKEHYINILREHVKEPYNNPNAFLEFIDYLDQLENKWWNGDPKLREKYAFNFAILKAISKKYNVIRAKLNAYYAYLVHRGYTSAYRLMKGKYVAGGESLYTWLRMYRSYQ